MSVYINKYLPELADAISLSDLDLLYITGELTGDYKVTAQNARKILNPVLSITAKTSDYIVLSSDCIGNIFSNSGASSAVTFTLPSVEDGLFLSFVVQSAYDLIIIPQPTEQIIQITSSVGESISNDQLNNSIMLRSTINGWYVVKKYGSW